GNVHDCREHHSALVGLDRVEPDLDGKLAAALLQTLEVTSRSHWPRCWICKERLPQPRMIGAITLRHEHLDWFAKQLITRIAEHPLGLRVDHLDEAGRTDHHNRVWRRLHYLAFAYPPLFRSGNVHDCREHHGALVGLDRAEP